MYDSNVDKAVQGYDWRADLYYGSAHIRMLIDQLYGKCFSGELTLDQVEKVFSRYNGSGPIAEKYGKDAIKLLIGASQGSQIMYFYQR